MSEVELGDIGNEITREYEAIALALDALGYMLRKTHDVALLIHMQQVAKPQSPMSHEFIFNTITSTSRTVLRNARTALADIMEEVGEARNNWDAVSETESQLTEPAFKAIRDLTNQERKSP